MAEKYSTTRKAISCDRTKTYYKLLVLEINIVYLACLHFHRALIVFKNFGNKKRIHSF